jgi:hypothetical protein
MEGLRRYHVAPGVSTDSSGGKPVIGAATFNGTTNVDKEKHMVVIQEIKVMETYFRHSIRSPPDGSAPQNLRT